MSFEASRICGRKQGDAAVNYSLRDDSTRAMTTTSAATTNTTAASAVATTSLGPPWIFHIVTVTAIAAMTPDRMTAAQTSRTRVTILSVALMRIRI